MFSRHQQAVDGFTDVALPSLAPVLSSMTNPRARPGVRCRFQDLLLVLSAAVLSGAKSLTLITEWAADAQSRGALTTWQATPSVTMIHRIVLLVAPVAFGWCHQRLGSCQKR